MKKKILILVLVITAILIIIGAIVVTGAFRSQKAMILVETVPISAVFINGEDVGKTPYEGSYDSGEISLKLVPESSDPLSFYETKVNLVPSVRSVVRHEFGEDRERSSGEIISFEEALEDAANLSIISAPNAADVSIDGASHDFTPTLIKDVEAGEHTLVLSAKGYKERVVKVFARKGYNLTLFVQLAKEELVQEKQSDEFEVKIIETPTGFLRVREDASLAAQEVFRVDSGDEFIVFETSSDKKWYRIKYEAERFGWISSEYASESGKLAQ